MADRYAYARGRVDRKLREWNTGNITLTRSTPGAPDPETPWTPGTPTLAIYTLSARVDGVAAEFIDGTTVVATDLMAIVSPKATLDGATVDLVPQMSDTLTIDGKVKAIKKIEGVPAAGPAARFHIFVAS